MRFSLIDFKKVQAEDFFLLIERNKSILINHFPKTLSFCQSIEDTKNFIAYNLNEMEERVSLPFCIVNLDTNELIGYIKILNIDSDIPKCELAFFTDTAYQKKGIMSTALSKMIHFIFEKLKMNKIYVRTAKDNLPSQKTVLKNGFVQEGILRNDFKDINGNLHDCVFFGLLKEEWNPSILK